MPETVTDVALKSSSRYKKSLPDEYFELKSRIHSRLLDIIDLSVIETLEKEALKAQIRQIVEKIIREEAINLPLNLEERE